MRVCREKLKRQTGVRAVKHRDSQTYPPATVQRSFVDSINQVFADLRSRHHPAALNSGSETP